MLAMHMANELLSLPVAGVTLGVAGVAVALAALRLRRRGDDARLPLMGVLGAFVFAAQMINFPVLPGTSGHLGGGVLLAIVLGPAAGILTMAGILTIQCLVFQDGGLLALGANIINLGVVPCLLGWVVYRSVARRAGSAAPWRRYLAAWGACVLSVAVGAALVPVEAAVSGVLRIPMLDFLAVMVGVHLIIGFVEGLITFAVIAFVGRVRPDLLPDGAPGESRRPHRAALAGSLLATALLLAGVISSFASGHPDGLEWSYQEKTYGDAAEPVRNDSPAVAAVDEWQARWSPLSDYSRRAAPLGQTDGAAAPVDAPDEGDADASADPAAAGLDGWTSLAGIVGTIVTLGVLYVVAVILRRRSTPDAGLAN